MKQLTISYVTLENGKKEQHTATEIVASTKSQNVLLREYGANDKFVKTVVEQDLFVDAAETARALRSAFEKQFSGEVLNALVTHAYKALDGACMFDRPKKD